MSPRLLAAGAVLLAVLAALAWLAPALPTHAAGPQDGDTPAAATGGGAANFGSATPTEHFIQSFQQQVSQQLQSAIAQSNEAQEARLRAFEQQQQQQLSEQFQTLQQSLPAAGSGVRPPAASAAGAADGLSDWENPRVNSRRVSATDHGAEASSSALSQPLSEALRGLAGAEPASAAPAVDIDRGRGDIPAGELGSTAHRRQADANVAPHGFIEGRLLNGVVAIPGGAEKDSIVALSGNYRSANGYYSFLDGCFALVQARPEIATGRIDFKLSRLTCNFADGASRTWDASGWLVDADGIRGVKALIVDNTDRKVAIAALGGAVGGIGQRLSQQQYQTNVALGGLGSSSTFTGSPSRDAIGGAATGAANALGQSIGDYYNLYSPSLQVGGGTAVTVVLANDLRLPQSARDFTQTHVATP